MKIDVKAQQEIASDLASRSEGWLIQARTLLPAKTLRFSQEFVKALEKVRDSLRSFQFKDTDCIRHICLFLSAISDDELLQILIKHHDGADDLKVVSTTYALNRFTSDRSYEAIDAASKHAKSRKLKGDFTLTDLITQGVFHFASLQREDVVEAIRVICRIYADVLPNLTPANAAAAEKSAFRDSVLPRKKSSSG